MINRVRELSQYFANAASADTIYPSWRERFSPRYAIGIILGTLAVMAWRATQSYSTGVFDFYPLYYGAKAWLHGGNAYVLDGVAPASHHGLQLFEIGNIYPLPAALLAVPLSLLPPLLAGTLWMGLLMAGLLVALRLHGWSWWLLLYLPVIEGLRIEQFTAFILILQIVALWAYRARHPWILAFCCMLILTKPNQGLIFVLMLFLLSRHWRQFLAAGTVIWGGSLLLDPNWIVEWIPTLINHHNTLHQQMLWPLALFAIPLLLLGNPIGAAIVAQFAMLPYPGVYASSAIPLGNLDDSRARWLILAGFLWVFPAAALDQMWATGLLLILPVVILTAARRWEARRTVPTGGPLPTLTTDALAG